jgi:cell division initiation protein
MKITSMDVHRKEFGHAVRGYREDEVDDFLDAVAIELDRLNTQIDEMHERMQQSESKALNFEAERNTINNALLTAQRASDDVLEQANEKAKKLLEDADARAEKTLLVAKQEKQAILEDLKHLKGAEEKFRAGILAHAHETIAQVKEVKVPRVPKRKKSSVAPAPAVVLADDVTELKLKEDAPEARSAPSVTPAPKATPAPTPPQPKQEEGIGQWGEMEDALETIA